MEEIDRDEDIEFDKLLDLLSKSSEACAVLAVSINRADDVFVRASLEKKCEDENLRRQQIKQRLRALLGNRISFAYDAGIQDALRRHMAGTQ